MQISLNVGPNNEHQIAYSRDWFTGDECLTADGRVVATRHLLSFSNLVSFPLRRRYEFTLGADTLAPLPVVFEKHRPMLLAGIRPHTYRVFVAGELVHQQTGY